jgi:S-adenosylmethionine decarboxylase
MAHDNTWQTKLMIRPLGPENYLLDPKDVNHPLIDQKMSLLNQEMREVFHLN